MKLSLTMLLLLVSNIVVAQDCDCSSEFSFVKAYYEHNSPAFQKLKNNPQEYSQYQKQVKQLTKTMAREKSDDRCNLYFEQYVKLLKDNHSGVDINLKRLDINFKDATELDSFKASKNYQSFRKIEIDTLKIQADLSLKSLNDIEGIYTNGGTLHLGIIKDKKDSYLGVVLRKTSLLDVGHVLLGLKKKDADTFEAAYHLGLLGFNFQSVHNNVKVKDGRIPQFGFYKPYVKNEQPEKPYEFKALDAQTNYIRLSSFDRGLVDELNAFYESIESDLNSKPYLVIDLRDNGGGDERGYYSLMPYLYTKPLAVDNVEVWVSPENIKRYEESSPGKSTPLIYRMKQAQPYTFIPLVENAINTWKLDSTTTYPKKIAVLFNRNTKSSAEGMITYAIQSDKVITVGENSGGYLGYGNVMEASTPCGKYTLRCTTTKYTNNSKYEYIGIEPTYKLSSDHDWVKYTQSLFQNF